MDVEKEIHYALLVGEQISAATMQNNMEIPQKLRNRCTL